MLISIPSQEEIALDIEDIFEDPFRGNHYRKQVEEHRVQNRFKKGDSTSKVQGLEGLGRNCVLELV